MRWRRFVGLVALLAIGAVSVSTEPRPAMHGTGFVVLLALVGVLAGGSLLLFDWYGQRRSLAVELSLYGPLLCCSATLVAVEPSGLGFFGAFVIAGTAPSRIPGRAGVAVATLCMVTVGVAGVLGAARPLESLSVSEVGVLGFYRLGMYALRLRQRTEESDKLLVQLETSRAVQLELATLTERQRLAREMHDVLAHSLSGLLLHLEAARLLAVQEEADPQLTDAIERAHSLAQHGLGEARQAIGTLRDESLPGPQRLAGLADEFTRDTGVPCLLHVSGDIEELSSRVKLTLYRVAQEALTNVRKHAKPERVTMSLHYEPVSVELIVEDGAEAGTAPAMPPHDHGYGVTGMRERAELLGGTLTAGPMSGGFRVRLWVPCL